MRQKGVIRVDAELKTIEYDREVCCIYLKFSEERVAKTVEHVPDLINVDFDKDGKLVGIEFIGVKSLQKLDKNLFIQMSNIYHQPILKQVPHILQKELACS